MAVNRREMSEVIREYRELKGISQKALAKEMSKDFPGVDHSLISKMENGLCEPTIPMSDWVCKALNELLESLNLSRGVDVRIDTKTSDIGDLTPLEHKVYVFMKLTSEDNRISRTELAMLTKLDDRGARDIIESLRKKGIRIGSGCGRKGYWLCRSEQEYRKFISEYSSRAYTVLKNKSAMDGYVEGQIRL